MWLSDKLAAKNAANRKAALLQPRVWKGPSSQRAFAVAPKATFYAKPPVFNYDATRVNVLVKAS